MEELDIGLKITATLPLTIVDQVLMFMGDVYIGLIPASLAPITYVGMLDFGISHFFFSCRQKYLW